MPTYDVVQTVRCLSQSQINKLTNAQVKETFAIVLNNYVDDEPCNALLFPSASWVYGPKFSLKTDNVRQSVTL